MTMAPEAEEPPEQPLGDEPSEACSMEPNEEGEADEDQIPGSPRSILCAGGLEMETCSTCTSEVPLTFSWIHQEGGQMGAPMLNDSFAESEGGQNDSLHISTEQELSQLEQDLGTGVGWERQEGHSDLPYQDFADDLAILDLLLHEQQDMEEDTASCNVGEGSSDSHAATDTCPEKSSSESPLQTGPDSEGCSPAEEAHNTSADHSFTFCVAPDPAEVGSETGVPALTETCWMRASGGLPKQSVPIPQPIEVVTELPAGWPLGLLAAALRTRTAAGDKVEMENVVVALVCNLQMHHMGAHHRAFYNHVYMAHHMLGQANARQHADKSEKDTIMEDEAAAGDCTDVLSDPGRVHENPLFCKQRRTGGVSPRVSAEAGTVDSSFAAIDESVNESDDNIEQESATLDQCCDQSQPAEQDQNSRNEAQVTSHTDKKECESLSACGSHTSPVAHEPAPAGNANAQEVLLTRTQVEEIARRAAMEAVTLAQRQPPTASAVSARIDFFASPAQEDQNDCGNISDCSTISCADREEENPEELEEWELVWECLARNGTNQQRSASTPANPHATVQPYKSDPGFNGGRDEAAELETLLGCVLEEPHAPATPPLGRERAARHCSSMPSSSYQDTPKRQLFGMDLVEAEPEEDMGIIDVFLQEHSAAIAAPECSVPRTASAQAKVPKPGSLNALLSAALDETDVHQSTSRSSQVHATPGLTNGRSMYEQELDRVGSSVNEFRQYLHTLQDQR